MRILHLTLKAWPFKMIFSGEKLEEYREVKPYWIKRLTNPNLNQLGSVELMKALMKKESFKEYDIIRFKNGYSSNSPIMDVEFKGIHYGMAKPEWIGFVTQNWYFCIELGKILSIKYD